MTKPPAKREPKTKLEIAAGHPVRSNEMEITKRALGVMHAALVVLGNRSMASVSADLKIGRLLNAISPDADLVSAGRQRITTDFVEEVNPEGSAVSAEIAGVSLQQQLTDYDLEKITVEIPVIRLNKADLPKEKAGEGGWKNARNIGCLVSDLGVLFEFPSDEKVGGEIEAKIED